MAADALVGPVERFVAAVTPALTRLAGADDGRLAADVVTEAGELLAAFIDADGVHTRDEVRAYIAAVGPHDAGVAYADPEDLRRSGLFSGRRTWIERPSAMFALLVDADARDGGLRSWTYYRVALDLAHAIASLDVHTSQAELDAIGRFRSRLLEAIAAAGVSRPGPDFFGLSPEALAEAQRRFRPDGAAGAPPTAAPTGVAVGGPQAAAEPAEELPPARPVDEVLADLDALIGLEPVKAEVRLIANLLTIQRLRAQRGLPTLTTSRHLVFTGNPGTGKTTVARLLAEVFRSLGVVERGHLVETDRSALVAGFVGQTATKTRAVIESAIGGVLLVDEAYALARGSETDFGREAIDTLVKLMEDHRDDLVVIAAGYPDEMATFIRANPGLESRFPKTLHFPDYSDDELVAIFRLIAGKQRYDLSDGAEEALRARLAAEPRDRGFGNGRLARNVFEESVGRHASRLVEVADPTDEQLVTLRSEDIPPPPSEAP